MRRVAIFVAASAVLAGCSSGTTSDADNQKLVKEFSQESYEQAMINAGKGAELEAEKKRDAAYRASTGQ